MADLSAAAKLLREIWGGPSEPLLEPYEMHEARKYVLDPVYSTSYPTRYVEEERDDGGDG